LTYRKAALRGASKVRGRVGRRVSLFSRAASSLQVSYAARSGFASSFDPPGPDIPPSTFAFGRESGLMLDLIYIAGGVAVLVAFGLYAVALRRV
jgi:hypothetical protein